jgi:threonine synthase
LPAKFAATIREALDIDPPRPPAYTDLESRPQRSTVLPPSAERVAAFIGDHDRPG